MADPQTVTGDIDPKIIQDLWQDPSFSGSFSGINTFQSALAMEKKIKISKQKLFSILRKNRNFLAESKKRYKIIPRRKIIVHGIGQMWQADLAMLFPFNGFIGFLLCIDAFSRRIFCEPLKKKDKVSVETAFKKIFLAAQYRPAKLETDQGQEFLSNKKFFSKEGIFFKIKRGQNKAALAERAIQTVKHRLFRLLRSLLSENWPKYLSQTVENINKRKLKAIGNLRPIDINSPLDDPKIDQAVGIPEDISFEEQVRNQEKYEKNKKNLQKGDYVFADFGPTPMAKGFDNPNYQIYKIVQIDAGKDPVLYKIADLRNKRIPGNFYRQELRRSYEPREETFRIEKIVGNRRRKGKEEVLVKYLHYPSKFNKWILKSSIVKGE